MNNPADRIYERLLLLRCQAGDETAYSELVERYSPRLRYFLRRLASETDAHAVEDILQDVWVDVFRGLARLVDLGAFPAWIYRIARDRAVRRLRRRQLPQQPLDDGKQIAQPDTEEFAAEDAARIHAALEKLPGEQREVLVLRFLEEMTYEDIARVVDDPVGTIRSRLHYAKRALRGILERNNEHD